MFKVYFCIREDILYNMLSHGGGLYAVYGSTEACHIRVSVEDCKIVTYRT